MRIDWLRIPLRTKCRHDFLHRWKGDFFSTNRDNSEKSEVPGIQISDPLTRKIGLSLLALHVRKVSLSNLQSMVTRPILRPRRVHHDLIQSPVSILTLSLIIYWEEFLTLQRFPTFVTNYNPSGTWSNKIKRISLWSLFNDLVLSLLVCRDVIIFIDFSH